MKIYLVSPGENDSRNLTDKGKSDIYSLIRKLTNDKIKVKRIYVNGHNVSRQTGNMLSKAFEVPIISDERFSEIGKGVILGSFNDLDLENLRYLNLFIDEIVARKNDVIITIGAGVHRAIISRLTGLPLQETRHFSFKSAGISTLYYDDGTGRWRINSLNDVNHLRLP